MMYACRAERRSAKGERRSPHSDSGGNFGVRMNAADMDLVFAPAGLGDVIGGLQAQERVHVHAKGFFNAQRHVPGKVALPLSKLDKVGRET